MQLLDTKLVHRATLCFMSRSVRLKEHLAAEVERLAKEERRSLAQMVELLLEQALRMDGEPITKEMVQTEPVYMQTQTSTTPRAERRRSSDPHFKPDFK